MDDKTAIIRDQNDKFRRAIPAPAGIPGRVVMTIGIQSLCDDEAEPNRHLPALISAVRDFDDFTEGNDPYGDHSFGAFDFRGHKIFWKFDYYDTDLRFGSEDPSDLTQTCRVLTIFLAEEY